MRTIKGTRREELEMIGTLSLFRSACLHIQDHTINSQLKAFIETLQGDHSRFGPTSKDIRAMHPVPAVNSISVIFSNPNLRFFAACKVRRIRYTTINYSKSKVADDSAIIFRIASEIYFGLINSIFTDEDNDVLFQVWPLSNPKILSITTNGQNIEAPFIQEGTLERENYLYVPIGDVVEKCVYWRTTSSKVIFFRFPNLEESS